MIKCFRLRLSGCAVRLAPDNAYYRILVMCRKMSEKLIIVS